MNKNIPEFKDRLNDLLFDNELSVIQFSNDMNLTASTVCRYLKGKFLPELPRAIKIADYFKCSLDFLFGLSEISDNFPHTVSKPFSENFKTILKENKCSRYRLSKDTEINPQRIDDWFNGLRLPSMNNLITVAKYFQCSLDRLVGRE